MISVKKKLILTFCFLVFPILVLAQIGGMEGPGASTNIEKITTSIANAVWIVFTGIAVVSFIIAGVLFLTAQGSAEKIARAKTAFFWGLAGVGVAILAFSIITLMVNTLF